MRWEVNNMDCMLMLFIVFLTISCCMYPFEPQKVFPQTNLLYIRSPNHAMVNLLTFYQLMTFWLRLEWHACALLLRTRSRFVRGGTRLNIYTGS